MRLPDAIDMLRGGPPADRPSTWADLGCGDGTFTRALSTLLAPGSLIHAVDRDARALRGIPGQTNGTVIETHAADFTVLPWPFQELDGILMANSLHYVQAQEAFVQNAASSLSTRRFLVVEYDTTRANPWVPHPLDRHALAALFRHAGYGTIRFLASRPSLYRRAGLYSALIEP